MISLKKHAILLSILVSTHVLSQQESIFCNCDFELEQIKDSIYSVKVENYDSLLSGETCYTSWINTGKNKPDGIVLVFDENNQKRRKEIYKNGIRTGTHYTWYASGEIESETTWETNLYFNSKGYFRSGKTKFTAENGNRPNAVYKSFFKNGNLQSIYDQQLGDKEWYENGQLKTCRNTKELTYTEWYENGQVKVHGKLVAGYVRSGVWKYYDSTGNLTRELTYEDELKAGAYFDESGYTDIIIY